MIIDIFKIGVYQKKLNCNVDQLKDFALWCEKNEKGRVLSNVGGYQSKDVDLKLPVITNLVTSITDNVNTYVSKIGLKTKLVIKDMWININNYKDTNKPHRHPGAIISGVYYVKTPRNCGNIIFNSMEEIEPYWPVSIIKNYETYNSPTWFLPAKEDECYLFPSWLKHSVDPNLNKDEKRISFSFNCVEVKKNA